MQLEKLSLLFAENNSLKDIYQVIASLLLAYGDTLSKKASDKILFVHHITSASGQIENQWSLEKLENGINQYITTDSTETKYLTHIDLPNKQDTWDDAINKYIDNKYSHLIVHLFGNKGHLDFQEKSNNNIGAILKKLSDKSSDYTYIIAYIDTHYQCESAVRLTHMGNNHHMMIIKSNDHDCYSTYIIKNLLNNHSSKTLAVLDKKYGDLCKFNLSEGYLELSRPKDDDAGRIVSFNKWIQFAHDQPKCYFSYASKDNKKKLMDNINIKIKTVMPFIHFDTDKNPNKTFESIEQYVQDLINGNIIVAIIGENYIKEPYPMYELISILDRLGVITNDTVNIDKLSKKGFIPLILDANTEKMLLANNYDLEEYWNNFNDHTTYSKEKIESIKKKIPIIKNVFKESNNNYLKNKTKNEISRLCQTIAWEIKKTLKNTTDYYDFYSHIEKAENFGFL